MANENVQHGSLFGADVKRIYFDVAEFEKESSSLATTLRSYREIEKDLFDFRKETKTFLINLEKPLGKIFKEMDPVARWAIRKSKKENVVVKKVESQDEVDEAYTFFAGFCGEREMLPLPSREEFSRCDVFIGRDGDTGEFLCFGAFPSFSNLTYTYRYGAGVHRGHEAQAMIWEAVQHAKKKGYKKFDMGGIVADPSDPSFHKGRFQFKKAFGGELTSIFTYVRIENRVLRVLLKPLTFFADKISSKRFIIFLGRIGLRKPLGKLWNRLVV